MCVVLGRIFGSFNSSSAPMLSSNALQCTCGSVALISNPFLRILCINPIIGNTSLIDWDKETYSASVLDKAIIFCSLGLQVIGQPKNEIRYPERDFAVLGSNSASGLNQFPAKSASTYASRDLLKSSF